MPDNRPLAATGHLFLKVRGVRDAATRLVAVGVRPIVVKEAFGVLELRGGTHIVVREADRQSTGVTDAPFDLMYDDIETAHREFGAHGFGVTEIKDGRIHRSFYATAPEQYRIQVLDSHAGDRSI